MVLAGIGTHDARAAEWSLFFDAACILLIPVLQLVGLQLLLMAIIVCAIGLFELILIHSGHHLVRVRRILNITADVMNLRANLVHCEVFTAKTLQARDLRLLASINAGLVLTRPHLILLRQSGSGKILLSGLASVLEAAYVLLAMPCNIWSCCMALIWATMPPRFELVGLLDAEAR